MFGEKNLSINEEELNNVTGGNTEEFEPQRITMDTVYWTNPDLSTELPDINVAKSGDN